MNNTQYYFFDNFSFSPPNNQINSCLRIITNEETNENNFRRFIVKLSPGYLIGDNFVDSNLIIKNIIFEEVTFPISKFHKHNENYSSSDSELVISIKIVVGDKIEIVPINFKYGVKILEIITDIFKYSSEIESFINLGFNFQEYGNLKINRFLFPKTNLFEIIENLEFYSNHTTTVTNKREHTTFYTYVKKLPEDIYLIGLLLENFDKKTLVEVFKKIINNNEELIMYSCEKQSSDKSPSDKNETSVITATTINKRFKLIDILEKYDSSKHQLYKRFEINSVKDEK